MSTNIQMKIPYEASPAEVINHPMYETLSRDFHRFGPRATFTYCDERHDGAKQIDSTHIAVIGQTGYGKSTLLNRLVHADAFESDAVRACTRGLQSADLLFKTGTMNEGVSFLDLPGIGENTQADQETTTLYEQTLSFAGVILFVLRADKRDHERDLFLWREYIKPSGLPTICVLNAIDKIEPLQRTAGLSAQQKQNLKAKKQSVAELFGMSKSSIYTVSSVEGWGIDTLWNRLIKTMLIS